MKFVASYSGGKDSILSLNRAISHGMTPVSLITTYNIDKNRSWFHGIPENVLNNVSESINIPIWLIRTTGEEYAINFEKTLAKAKENGAEVCVFGDIDIEDHFMWCNDRCKNVGIKAYFPLWKESRKEIVYEFIDKGFIANITIIDTNIINEKYLGDVLSKELVDQISKEGADICGENGEYHTFVSDGLLFKNKVSFSFSGKRRLNNLLILPII